ncbi:MAG: pyruvate kinase [Candidatus Omnitrophota bacterium]
MIPKTKIIATLGPASCEYTTIRKMMLSGLDVARLNFSHATQKEHKNRIETTRALNKKYRRHIKLLGDLEGFRIRVGELKKPINLKRKNIVYLEKDDLSDSDKVIPFDYQGDFRSFKKNQNIFIDDGNLVLRIIKVSDKSLQCQVEAGGILKARKGINIPNAKFRFSNLSTKDAEDIEFCIENKLDFIAQSFVRTRKDIKIIKDIVKSKLSSCKIIAKIENKEGIRNINEIIDESDGIMIARGDMGVSMPIYQIAIIQKEIIKKCNKKGKFVITATQMLESMTEHLRPTRAEVSDITNAIIDGSNFVMLSAETAVGKFPVQAVDMMNKIIKFTESSSIFKKRNKN